MVENTVPTQVFTKKLFQGLCKEKLSKTVNNNVAYIHIIIILIILIQELHHTLVQVCHHTLIVSVHIVLLFLFIYFTELHIIHIYHNLENLYRTPPSFIPYSTSTNLLPTDLNPHSSMRMNKNSRNTRNQHSNLMKRNRRDARRRR